MSLVDQVTAGLASLGARVKTHSTALKGGTAGQILTKTSGTDYATAWSPQQATGLTPASGGLQQPLNFGSGATGTPTAGTLYLEPFDIGPNPLTIQSLGVSTVAAYVAGASTGTYSLALWPDDGTGGQPAWSSLLVQGNLVPTSAGLNTYFTTSQTLPPGRWWAGFLYVQGATAPTTPATFTCIAAVTPSMWIAGNNSIGTSARALRALAQTAIPTTQPTVSITGNNDAPVIALRRA